LRASEWGIAVQVIRERSMSGCSFLQLLPESNKWLSQTRTEQAVIAHLHEAFRQYMLKETVDEIFSI